MSIESATEQGLKTAFRAYTDTLAPADAVTYRCFFLDDEEDSGDTVEAREYPFIEITASPNAPESHKSSFQDVPVLVKWATNKNTDHKKAALVAMYAGCRAIIDTETTITVSGYSLIGAIVEAGGVSGVDDNEQFIELPLLIKLCGA